MTPSKAKTSSKSKEIYSSEIISIKKHKTVKKCSQVKNYTFAKTADEMNMLFAKMHHDNRVVKNSLFS